MLSVNRTSRDTDKWTVDTGNSDVEGNTHTWTDRRRDEGRESSPSAVGSVLRVVLLQKGRNSKVGRGGVVGEGDRGV